MRTLMLVLCCALLGGMCPGVAYSQAGSQPEAVTFEGARLIVGDGSTAIDDGTFVVQAGHISAIGPRSKVKAPAGAAHVDLTGRTVTPTLINVHVHIGYEGYTTWGAENYTARNVLDHLQREAFYGVGATQSVGSSPTDASIELRRIKRRESFRWRRDSSSCRGWRHPMADPTQF